MRRTIALAKHLTCVLAWLVVGCSGTSNPMTASDTRMASDPKEATESVPVPESEKDAADPRAAARLAGVTDDNPIGTRVECHHIADMVQQLRIHYGVKIQLALNSEDATPRGLASIHTVSMPNRHWLRLLLGRENLTCTLDGDVLLIKRLGRERTEFYRSSLRRLRDER